MRESSMRRALLIGAVLVAASPSASYAQDVYTKAAKAQFDMIKVNLSKTVAKVPEDLYSFKPTPQVRSMGELLGHVADANFLICSVAAGEKPPQGGFEKGEKTKAKLSKG